jgi:hypothetical protein
MTSPIGDPPTQGPNPAGPAQTPQIPPIRSRPKMLAFLIVAFVLWMAFLLLLYFTTVYPMRHPAGQ